MTLFPADATRPIAVVSDPATQDQHVIATDNDSGAFVVWRDFRNPPGVTGWLDHYTVIYAQRVISAGGALWQSDGIPIVDLQEGINYFHSRPAIVSDGDGGALIGFLNNGVYVQHLDGDGNMLWGDSAKLGITVTNLSGQLLDHLVMAGDGNGGAIVVWGESFGGIGGRLYAQKIDKQGKRLWGNGVELFTVDQYIFSNAFNPRIVSNKNGNTFIVWNDFRVMARPDIYVQQLDNDGKKKWGADGKMVIQDTVDDNYFFPTLGILSDGSGGVFVSWDDTRATKNGFGTFWPNVFVQHLDKDGNRTWSAEGVRLSDLSLLDCGLDSCTGFDSLDGARQPVIAHDGSGGIYAAWLLSEYGEDRVYSIRAQRVAADANILWGSAYTQGLPLSSSLYFGHSAPVISSDGKGGAFVAWPCTVEGTTERDMCAQHIDGSGNKLGGVIGANISNLAGIDSDPQIIAGASGKAVVTWANSQNIYAQLVDEICNEQWLGVPDAMIRDNEQDNGVVPSTTPWWDSPDIWVRNNPDGVGEHQDPVKGQTNVVYARVWNTGTLPVGDVMVHIYQTAPGMGLKWPGDWTEIGSTSIAQLSPKQSRLVSIPWTPSESGHVCLFARLVSDDDPITAEGDVPADNNISQKNVDIITLDEGSQTSMGSAELDFDSQDSMFEIVNPQNQAVFVDVIIELDALALGGTVLLDLGDDLFDGWESAGGTLQGAEVVPGTSSVLVTASDLTVIGGIPMNSEERAMLTATINGPPTDVNWLYINIWERIDGEAVGGIVLRSPINYDLTTSTKTASAAQVQPGGLVTYTLTLTNQGNLDHPAVSIEDRLPVSVTLVSDSLTWTAGEGDYEAGIVVWNGPVNLEEHTQITYTGIVDEAAIDDLMITNTVTLDDGYNPIIERVAVVEVKAAEEPDGSNLYLPLTLKGD
jgi:uncharacterized repeat protein (TIGR01451 family)